MIKWSYLVGSLIFGVRFRERVELEIDLGVISV